MKVRVGKEPLSGFLENAGEYPILDLLGVRSVNILYIVEQMEEREFDWYATIKRKSEYVKGDGDILTFLPLSKPFRVRYDIEGHHEDSGEYDIRTPIKPVIRVAPTRNPATTLRNGIKTILNKRYGLRKVKVSHVHIEFDYNGSRAKIIDDIRGGFVFRTDDGRFKLFNDNRVTYEEIFG